MLTESLGALQRGVFLLSGKPCCHTCPPLMVVFSRGTSVCGQVVPPACPHTGSIDVGFPMFTPATSAHPGRDRQKGPYTLRFLFLVGFEST